ncbi:MAG: hypothetical protein F9K43_08055, partial [Bauldia sp.]
MPRNQAIKSAGPPGRRCRTGDGAARLPSRRLKRHQLRRLVFTASPADSRVSFVQGAGRQRRGQMRNVVITVRRFLLVTLTAFGAALAAGQVHAAEARVIVTPEADYSGFDFETLKGVDLEACKVACLDKTECRAFTFNTRAGWCFLKSDFGILAATPGATAGRVVETPELTPSLERQRLAELDFLSGSYVDEARSLAGALRRRFNP